MKKEREKRKKVQEGRGDLYKLLDMHGVVPPPQESMDNGPSLFDYGMDNPHNDLIDDFDPYLKYGKGYQNKTAFENAFYR